MRVTNPSTQGLELKVWFITADQIQSFNKQKLTKGDGYKYQGTSSKTPQLSKPAVCVIRFHSWLRSDLNWDPTAGRVTISAILDTIISYFIKT